MGQLHLRPDAQKLSETVSRLRSDFQVEVLAEWGESGSGGDGEAKAGAWTNAELDRLHDTLSLFANAMGGREKFIQNLEFVAVQKSDIGSHGGEALAHKVSFSVNGSFSPWTVIHEFAHAWDARHEWGLSKAMEKYTGGHTSRFQSFLLRLFGMSDSAFSNFENQPRRHGRKPGCNAAGYFYGDKPSGSNWSFNRVEDFAESVAMYVGWEKGNSLSRHARDRIIRYTLNAGEKDAFSVPDDWPYYRKYFYPEAGDYAGTLRWKFVDELIRPR